MTKERKAEVLLECALAWQNNGYVSPSLADLGFARDIFDNHDIPSRQNSTEWIGMDVWASAALSEVCHGLGFELEDDES